MRGGAIILSGLLLTAACGPVEVASVPDAPAPATPPVSGPRRAGSAEVYPVPAGAACAIRGGWSTDGDPAGLNVRAGPSAGAPVVGVLPPPEYSPAFDRVMAVTFDVIETRDGWFRIANAYLANDDAGEPSGLPSGWISGRHVGFELQTDVAFAEPDPGSPVVAAAWMDSDGALRRFEYRQPSECRGEWVRLKVTDHDRLEREAWARGVCNSQETSCDGARGDDLAPDEIAVH
jgi:hypothetical protein